MIGLDIMFYILIVRACIKTDYYPIAWGLVYGGFCFVSSWFTTQDWLVSGQLALSSGGVCALSLYLLSRFENQAIIWWPLFIVGLFTPVLAKVLWAM